MPGGVLPPARERTPGHPVTTLSERPAVATSRATRRVPGVLRAYVALTKPRIIELLLVTTLPAMMLAAGGWPSWRLLVPTLVGGTLAAGAANVFNCWYDRDIDRLMHRTERRPLPMGIVTPRAALAFGLVLTVTSIALLAATTNLLAAALAAGAIAYYTVVYTMVLKRHTRHSTLFGGVPGAAPVLIGWAAVTGSLAWPAVVFFGVVFCWQMPHFWALAMRFRADYQRADVPMLPVVATPSSVGRQTVAWAWGTVAVSLLLWLETTPLATALAAVAILAYSVVYTMVLKRRTRHNTVFGAFPGAAPVLIGWAAVTGSLSWPAVVFFGIVFCWQMPHFWALASRFREDYARAGVPMLSVVAGPESVGRQSVTWAWATLGATLLMGSITPELGWAFAIGGGVLGAWYVVESSQWLDRIRAGVPDRPMKLFSVSITHMTLLSIAIAVDVLV